MVPGGRAAKRVAQDEISASGIGVIEVARLVPADGMPPFVVASIYARWMKPHPTTEIMCNVGYQDGSAHAATTDLSAFIGHKNPATHRILAAGDFNTIRGATENNRLALPSRDQTIFQRMDALGLEFLGPLHPNGRQVVPRPHGLPRRHRERSDVSFDAAVSKDGCEPAGLCVRFAGFPRRNSGSGVE